MIIHPYLPAHEFFCFRSILLAVFLDPAAELGQESNSTGAFLDGVATGRAEDEEEKGETC